MHTLFENYKLIDVQTGVSLTVDAQSTPIDLGPEYLDDVMIIASIGAVTGTTPTLDILIQTSDLVGGTYTTVDSFSQSTDANANQTASAAINMQGQNNAGDEQRFLRLSFMLTGTTPDFGFCAVALVKALVGSDVLNSKTFA